MEREDHRNQETRNVPYELLAMHCREIETGEDSQCNHQKEPEANHDLIEYEKKKATMAWTCAKNG